MDQPCQQLLARSAFAEHQHRGRQLGHLLHEIDDVARELARADDELAVALVGDLGAERHHLAVQVLALARVVDQRPQRLVVEVLGGVVVGAVLHRLDRGLDLGNGRDHDHFNQAVVFLDDAQDVETVDAGQPHVEQHQVDVFAVARARPRRSRRAAPDNRA